MQPLERLVNLVALLLDSRTALTFEQIREKLAEAYEHDEIESAKRMFERDKDLLRDIGVPIEVVATDAWDVEQGYRIAKDRYYLPEIAFTPEEISALFVAVRWGEGRRPRTRSASSCPAPRTACWPDSRDRGSAIWAGRTLGWSARPRRWLVSAGSGSTTGRLVAPDPSARWTHTA